MHGVEIRINVPCTNVPESILHAILVARFIYFDDDAPKSINGKFVPQDQRTGIAHQCPESDYNGGGRTSATMTDEDRLARPERIEVRMQEAKRQEDPLN